MLSLADAFLYLGYDETDEVIVANVQKSLDAAVQTLYGAIGEDVETYLPGDPRTEELIKIYLDELHSNRGLTQKVSGSTRRMVHNMETQLRLELRTAKELSTT